MHVPAERALAAEKRQERQAVRELVSRLGRAQRPLQPRVQVPAIRERTAFAEPPLVQAVEEEPRPRLGRGRLVDDAGCGRRPDHHRRASGSDAAGADVRAGAIAESGPDARDLLVGDGREPRGVEPDCVQRLVVPRQPVRVEEPGAARR